MTIRSEDLVKLLGKEKAAEILEGTMPKRKHNKYNVNPSEARTWNGRTYDSKMEMEYAKLLYAKKQTGDIVCLIEQPLTRLGVPENTYRPDFFVAFYSHAWHNPFIPMQFIDVKGQETAGFKRTKKLWKKYGDLPLVIVKKRGSKFEEVETIIPEQIGGKP